MRPLRQLLRRLTPHYSPLNWFWENEDWIICWENSTYFVAEEKLFRKCFSVNTFQVKPAPFLHLNLKLLFLLHDWIIGKVNNVFFWDCYAFPAYKIQNVTWIFAKSPMHSNACGCGCSCLFPFRDKVLNECQNWERLSKVHRSSEKRILELIETLLIIKPIMKEWS